MGKNRFSLVIALLICVSMLCSCAGGPDSGKTVETSASTDAEALSLYSFSFCTTHSYTEWSDPQATSGGPWVQTRSCTVCGKMESRETEAPEPAIDLGSAAKLSGTTLIVSIFADDAQTSWDFDTKADKDMADTMHKRLGNAVHWIAQQCRAYDTAPEFFYDWEEYPDLYYTFDFGEITLVRPDGGGYWTQTDYIESHIDTDALKEKYSAENIIYVFYFNTGKDNTVNSWSLSDTCGCYTEIINLFVLDDYSGGNYIESASGIAHEILHCFGAYDLYYASEEIPQEYVDHLQKTRSNDIMYTISLGESVSQEFSELDAYYVGLIDSCSLVDTWGLATSTHAPKR